MCNDLVRGPSCINIKHFGRDFSRFPRTHLQKGQPIPKDKSKAEIGHIFCETGQKRGKIGKLGKHCLYVYIYIIYLI